MQNRGLKHHSFDDGIGECVPNAQNNKLHDPAEQGTSMNADVSRETKWSSERMFFSEYVIIVNTDDIFLPGNSMKQDASNTIL